MQAITYLQSATRLKGSEEITEDDISEIAGVSELQWNPSIVDTLGPSEVSCIERYPHFRGEVIKKGYFGHSKVSLIRRCPYFKGVF